MPGPLRSTSKFLSYVLRHRPDEIGLTLDDEGWVAIDTLVAAARDGGRELTRELVLEVVRTNDQQRFRISDDGMRIRASQGHSIKVDLALEEAVPPDQLFHGTADRNVDAIMVEGLHRQNRQHVHLSKDRATARNVGARHGRPVVLLVDAAAMQAAGHRFHLSDNGVWLTAHVPPEFLARVD